MLRQPNIYEVLFIININKISSNISIVINKKSFFSI